MSDYSSEWEWAEKECREYRAYEPFYGKWYIRSCLGKGGWGVVFDVEQRHADGTPERETEPAALKIIETGIRGIDSEAERKQLQQEFYLMDQVSDCPNVVKCRENCDILKKRNGELCITICMERLTSVEDLKFKQNDVIRLGIDICCALEACQANGIIHRDIKPGNIYISDTGEYKLGDFGISRIQTSLKKQCYTCIGTRGYMAPEMDQGYYDRSVDIYALGRTLQELSRDCPTDSRLWEIIRWACAEQSKQRCTLQELQRALRGLLPTASAYHRDGVCGKKIRWELKNGILQLTGEGPMYDYEDPEEHDSPVSSPWSRKADAIYEIEIGNDITSIGSNAFRGCIHVQTVSLPDELYRIGEGAFYECRDLKKIRLPQALEWIRARTFCGCENLEKIKFPEDMELEEIGECAFAGTDLQRVLLPESVRTIGTSAFSDCTELKAVRIPKKMEYIGECAFENCGLTTVAIPQKCRMSRDAFDINVKIRRV